MNESKITRMFLTTAVLAAVAVLIAGPAEARFLFPDDQAGPAATRSSGGASIVALRAVDEMKLAPEAKARIRGIMMLTPVQRSAAFGTG